MFFTSIVIALVIFFALITLHKRRKKKRKYPPGPKGWPIIGNFFEFRNQPLASLTKWNKKYGNIVGLKIGSYRVVILSSVKILKESFNNPIFNARPTMRPMVIFSGGVGNGTLTATNHNDWDETRKFTMKELNRLGFGKKGTEDVLMSNVETLVQHLREHPTSVCLYDEFLIPVTRYVWLMLTGNTLRTEETIEMRNMLLQFQKSNFTPVASIFYFIPEIVDLFPKLTGYSAAKEDVMKFHHAFKQFLDKGRDMDFDEETNHSNFIDACIRNIRQHKHIPQSSFHNVAGENNSKAMAVNLFVTGVLSLCNAINWAISYMATQPEIQDKIYVEIIEVLQHKCDHHSIQLKDVEKMPYTIAFMKETLRMSSTAPFSNFHSATTDVEFHGYFIPKDTLIIGNLYGANHNEDIWGDPEVFRPERFLGINQNLAAPVLSFSVGLRTCIGQEYTKNAFFLFITAICQNFKVLFDVSVNAVPTVEDMARDSTISVFRFSKPYIYNLESRTCGAILKQADCHTVDIRGPNGWPIIGNFFEFRNQPLTSLTKWNKKYGNIVGLKIGSYRVVLLSGVEILKESFNNPVFNARPTLRPTILFSGGVGKGTLTATNHNDWDETRKFTIKELNRLGFGKKGTEDVLMSNVETLVQHLREHPTSVCLYDEFLIPVTRYVWLMLTGSTLNTEETIDMRNKLQKFQKTIFTPVASIFFLMPEMVDLFPSFTGYSAAKEDSTILHNAFKRIVDKARDMNFDKETNHSNFIDACIQNIQQNKHIPESSFHKVVGENNSKAMAVNLFVTGVLALCNALNWAIVYMATEPEIQDKIYVEIVDAPQKKCNDHAIQLTDVDNMPYTIAFIKETLRMSSTAPFANLHSATADVDFYGYFIPKDTLIIGNLYGANHDEDIWGDPEVFRPERFFGINQNLAAPVLSFSVGLRTCIGQEYTKNVFFLFITVICQNFKVVFDMSVNSVPTAEDLARDCTVSIFRFCKPYIYHLESRTCGAILKRTESLSIPIVF